MYPYYSIFVQEMLSNVGNVRDVLQLSGELWYTDWVINLSGRFASSSPKERALGKTMNFVWIAKASHFEERLSPAGERCRNSDRVGNVAARQR